LMSSDSTSVSQLVKARAEARQATDSRLCFMILFIMI